MAAGKGHGDAVDGLIDRAVAELAGKARREVSEHPSVDRLVDYQEGRLHGSAAAVVRDHLAVCTQCADEMLELAAFDQEHDPALEPSEDAVEEDWASLQRALNSTPTAATSTRAPRRRFLLHAPWMRAAAVVSLVLALGLMTFWLGDGGDRWPGNPFFFEMRPVEENLVRSAVQIQRVEVPPRMNPLIARLNLGGQTPYESYSIEALSSTGEAVWMREAQRQPAGNFLAVLPRKTFPAGVYRLRLIGRDDGREIELAEYVFELVYATDP